MITLDYRTDNPRWGISGIVYTSWESFAFSLGYLANEIHYRNIGSLGMIELHFEGNDEQGAWGKEGRIHYYGTEAYLLSSFSDWYNAKSAGVGNITCRVNSNEYMYSLVHDFGFEEKRYVGYTTADIFPPRNNAFSVVWDILEKHLVRLGCSVSQVDDIYKAYEDGWNE